MIDYDFYVNSYLGSVIPEKAFPGAMVQAQAVLDKYRKCYQVTGGEWDPTTIQWTNKPAANILLESNISNNDRTKYQFSVLTAVQHWYDGDPTGQNENYGIMLRN